MVATVGTLNRVGAAVPVPAPSVAPTFGVGEQHVGTVLRILPQGGALATLHGQHLVLEPGVALHPGDTFVATVAQVTPELVLQLTRSDPDLTHLQGVLTASAFPPSAALAPTQTTTASPLTPAQLKAYLEASQPLGQGLAGLAQLLEQHPWLQRLDAPLVENLRATVTLLRPEGDLPPDAAQLQEQAERSGVNYEKKVERAVQGEAGVAAALAKDLKGQLLQLAQHLESWSHNASAPQAQDAADLLPQVTRLLESVEFQQVVNQLAPAAHQPVVLPLMLPQGATSQPMSLAVRREGHAGATAPDASEPYSLVLQLELTGLGPLHIAATVHGSQVTTTFQVQAPEIAALVQEAAPELIGSLRQLGFLAQVACDVQPHLVVEVRPQVPRTLSQAMHLVDVTI